MAQTRGSVSAFPCHHYREEGKRRHSWDGIEPAFLGEKVTIRHGATEGTGRRVARLPGEPSSVPRREKFWCVLIYAKEIDSVTWAC